MKRDKIEVNDRQLACARIQSEEGQNYLKAMSAAQYCQNRRTYGRWETKNVTSSSQSKLEPVSIDDLNDIKIYNPFRGFFRVQHEHSPLTIP